MRTSLGLSGDPARGAPQRRAFRSETRRATRAALTQHTDATTHTDVRARGPRGASQGGGGRGTRARTHARPVFSCLFLCFRPHARAAPRGAGARALNLPPQNHHRHRGEILATARDCLVFAPASTACKPRGERSRLPGSAVHKDAPWLAIAHAPPALRRNRGVRASARSGCRALRSAHSSGLSSREGVSCGAAVGAMPATYALRRAEPVSPRMGSALPLCTRVMPTLHGKDASLGSPMREELEGPAERVTIEKCERFEGGSSHPRPLVWSGGPAS